MSPLALPTHDIVVYGAGIIGLSIALELHSRGAQVLVVERDTALSHASTAAAGMLAVNDPGNPATLQRFAEYSVSRYDAFLRQIQEASGEAVPYQTTVANQYRLGRPAVKLQERSIDPRQLASAILSAVRHSSIALQEYADAFTHPPGVPAIRATGAWTQSARVYPRKGQMLRVQLPNAAALTEVHRSEDVYVVPRTSGAQSGTALIGATVEDVGFDTTTTPAVLDELREAAATLCPDLAFLRHAQIVESWAGLRPASPDLLPVIGETDTQTFVATGHFRNGILLAPGTARIIADLVQGIGPAVDLSPFAPNRFGP